MIIPKEVECRTCSQVFCCAKCRQKHEDKTHKEDAMLRKICYICNDRPFPLRKDTKVTPNNLLIAHVLKEHLPLQCNRCTKVFYTLRDFQEITKCFTMCLNNSEKEQGECHLETNKSLDYDPPPTIDDENKENFETDQPESVVSGKGRRKSSLLSNDGLPNDKIEEVDEALLTPLSKINLRWKRKSRQSFDSMLSMTNNTSEVNGSGMLRVEGANGAVPRKLVRTTSTPMYQWQLMPPGLKQPNESYSATMGQMSSIHCSSGSETDSRAEDLAASPLAPNELDKVRAIIRNRSKAVTTPLRQVMSKSIQRAIAQHAGATGTYSKMLQPGTQRKMSFSSTMSSGMNSMLLSPGSNPLDLRTTPVLKRMGSVSSNGSSRACRMIRMGDPGQETIKLERAVSVNEKTDVQSLPSHNMTEESEYYEAHDAQENESVEQEDRGTGREWQTSPNPPDTPKHNGAALKKVQSATDDFSRSNDADDDIWGTPCSGVPPRSFSYSPFGTGDTFKSYDASVEDAEDDSTSDDVFYPTAMKRSVPLREPTSRDDGTSYRSEKAKSDGTAPSGSRLWSIVSNVIRLASRGDVQEELSSGGGSPNVPSNDAGPGLIQRAASFAGYLRDRYARTDGSIPRTSSSGSDEYRVLAETYSKKRRRVTTTNQRSYVPGTSALSTNRQKLQYSSPVAKRKRIQSRQPIQRLRNTSSESGGSGSGTMN